ncbi:BlaI/MecI/CopY family transcriptional regulator [Steroidobacter flavus]|uniref:BlaI/MecI/CopY family transcriptional regulator n=1 Tax=Steroidobacter flavus TaxID=1842136 RepID=A0ABV8SZG9_9GAMM
MKATKAELGELERAVMKIVWAQSSLSAEAIREKLDRGLKETTIRTVLRRLEVKGYVSHKVENRTFLYEAVEARRKVAARAIKRIVDWFCDGSVDEVLVGLVDAKMVDRAQVDRLLSAIEQAERQSKDDSQRSRSKKGARS